ncbi:MAG TPA: hypothetical protein PKB15_08660 [Acidimicrobiia bacterium]|nr:hypothetical protein [Acidimicrobiia bacterium]
MAMRYDCKNFESRTYATGEVVRRCRMDLAPNAPWECPQDCLAFEKRLVDVGWDYGSLAQPIVTPVEKVEGAHPDHVANVLDEAEDIVNAITPELLAEFQALDESNKKGRRKKKRKKK